MTQNSHARSLLAIFFLAFFLRGAVLFLDTRSFDRDPEHYRQVARSLRAEGALLRGKTPTALFPPLYPAMLAHFMVNMRSVMILEYSDNLLPGGDLLQSIEESVGPA
ncbi:MAG: hypothetical protein J6S75_08290, partial [Thermoguttaceae bacterium]|nr:hypothetical protein [Thermoguttaceae bacterium]